MTITNKPSSGDPLVENLADSFGDRYVATKEFWHFLDELTDQVNAIDYEPPANEIVINEVSDFYDIPPTTNEIILQSGKTYRIGGNIDISPYHLRVPEGGSVIFKAANSTNSIIISDTTGALINAVDSLVFADHVGFSVQNGRVYNISQVSGAGVVVEKACLHAAAAFPSLLNNLTIAALFESQFLNCASGVFSLSGSSFGEFLSRTCNFDAGIVGDAVALNDTILTAVDIISARFVSTATNNLLSSSVGPSGNLVSGRLGRVIDARVVGDDVTLANIQPDHIRWLIKGVKGIENSSIDLFAYTTDDETITIGTTGTFAPLTPVAGSWTVTKQDRWSMAANGEATYTGETPSSVSITAVGSITNAGGSSDEVQMRVNIDTGSGYPAPPPIYTTGRTQSQAPTQVVSNDLVEIQPGDKVRAEVANFSAVRDVEVSQYARLIITSPPPR